MSLPVLQPLRFESFLRPMIWGGRKIARFLGKNLAGNGPYGESWEVSDHPLHASRLATASGYGVTLRQLMNEDRWALLGPAAARYTVFPWLIKLLDAHDWLSVQVHPDEDSVKQLWPGETAKTEAWYVLDADPAARIYAGFQPGVGEAQLRDALARGTVAECLHRFTPRVGDLIYLPAGTVHAVGGGVLLAEIQQTSDATFRLFDWNRVDAHGKARTLHIEEAIACIHWDQGAIEPTPAVNGPYFQIERLTESRDGWLGGRGVLQALIVTAGQGRFANGEFFMPGDAWILPAGMSALPYHLETPLAGLLATLPTSEPDA